LGVAAPQPGLRHSKRVRWTVLPPSTWPLHCSPQDGTASTRTGAPEIIPDNHYGMINVIRRLTD